MNSYSTSWSLLLVNRPCEDERLSWPCWLTYSRRLIHKVIIHPASSQVQDRESSPVKDRRSTTVLHRWRLGGSTVSKMSTKSAHSFRRFNSVSWAHHCDVNHTIHIIFSWKYRCKETFTSTYGYAKSTSYAVLQLIRLFQLPGNTAQTTGFLSA